MILSMERTLNSAWFFRRNQVRDSYCTLSTGQYWDLLTYVDVSRGEVEVDGSSRQRQQRTRTIASARFVREGASA